VFIPQVAGQYKDLLPIGTVRRAQISPGRPVAFHLTMLVSMTIRRRSEGGICLGLTKMVQPGAVHGVWWLCGGLRT
jgi:hypothetical protein